jgi:hypothetical protein
MSPIHPSGNGPEDRHRICHWSRIALNWIAFIAFGVFSIPMWGLPNRESIGFAIAIGAFELMALRGAFSGAIFRKNYLIIRDNLWTHRIEWRSIRNVEICRRNHDTRLKVNLKNGKSYPVRSAEGRTLFPASALWVADASLKLES